MKRVCRTCLSEVTNAIEYFALKNDADSQQVKRELELCIPEMIIDLVMEPVLCLSCVTALHSAYDFKSRCLHTEMCLQNWMRDNREQNSRIDLSEILGSNMGHTDDHLVLQDTEYIVTKTAKHLQDSKFDYAQKQGLRVNCKFAYSEEGDEINSDYNITEHNLVKIANVDYTTDIVTDITNVLLANTLSGAEKQEFRVASKSDYNVDKMKSECDESTDTRELEDVKEEVIMVPENFDNFVINNEFSSSEDGFCTQNNVSSFDVLQKSTRQIKPCCVLLKRSPNDRLRLQQQQRHHMGNATSQNIKKYSESSFEAFYKSCSLTNTTKAHKKKEKSKRRLFTFGMCTYGSIQHLRIPNKEGFYWCNVCKYTCMTKRQITTHVKTSYRQKLSKCNVCKYKTAKREHLKQHMRIHTEEKLFECRVCKYKTERKYQLKQHMMTHTGEKPFECNVCKYKTARKHHLKQHMGTHTGEKPFECRVCKYKTARKESLQQHMKTHTGEKPFECKLCEHKTARKASLKQHMRTHTGEKPFECNVCKYKTARKQQLEQHMRKHTGEKPFECNVCKYKTAQKKYLRQHVRTHTGEKPFECKVCEYKTARKEYVKQHMRRHTGEKPFECRVCKYKTAEKPYLRRHMRTHTGEKPFECKVCEYKTARKEYLKQHMRRHTGEKPFKCKVCESKTAQTQNLKQHMSIHTSKTLSHR